MQVHEAHAFAPQRLRKRFGLRVDALRIQRDEAVLRRSLQDLCTLAHVPDEMTARHGACDVAQVAIDAAAGKARNVEDASVHGEDV